MTGASVLVDSHCHLSFPELLADIENVVARMQAAGVSHALCVSVSLETLPAVLSVAERFANIYASVGVHPDQFDGAEPDVEQLIELARHPKVVAIGETGLDYFHQEVTPERQKARFRTHIAAARRCAKPLIIHTRSAAEDTLAVMREENAADVGGVMHCFTESMRVATEAIAMNFFISFSGIVTFKNAVAIKEVATAVPLERTLVETDSPYLAPVPFRGKPNEPAFVRHVAVEIARLKKLSVEEVSAATTRNFFQLFQIHD